MSWPAFLLKCFEDKLLVCSWNAELLYDLSAKEQCAASEVIVRKMAFGGFRENVGSAFWFALQLLGECDGGRVKDEAARFTEAQIGNTDEGSVVLRGRGGFLPVFGKAAVDEPPQYGFGNAFSPQVWQLAGEFPAGNTQVRSRRMGGLQIRQCMFLFGIDQLHGAHRFLAEHF
jgi:hypothetical protein